MLSNEIQEWLERKGSFKAGVDLYFRTGHRSQERYFQHILQRPFLPADAKAALIKSLRKHLVENPSERLSASSAAIPAERLTRQEPDVIQHLRAKGRKFLKQRDALRAQLVQMAQEEHKYSNADRFDLAQQIMDFLQPQIDEIYTKIRYWENDGELPSKESLSGIVRDTVEQFKRVMSLRPAISRLKKRYELEKDKHALEKELLEKGIELHDLEEALGLQLTVLPSSAPRE